MLYITRSSLCIQKFYVDLNKLEFCKMLVDLKWKILYCEDWEGLKRKLEEYFRKNNIIKAGKL